MHVCDCAWVLHTAAKSRANVSSSLRISRISSPSMMVSLVMGGPPRPPGVDEERTCTASDGVDDTVPPLPSPCAVAMVHVRRTRQQCTSTQPCVCEARELGWVWAISRNKSTCTRDTHRVLLFSSVAHCSCVQLQRTLGAVRPRPFKLQPNSSHCAACTQIFVWFTWLFVSSLSRNRLVWPVCLVCG